MPLGVNRAGNYFLSLVDFCRGPSGSNPCPEAPASLLAILQEAPDPSDGGLQ